MNALILRKRVAFEDFEKIYADHNLSRYRDLSSDSQNTVYNFCAQKSKPLYSIFILCWLLEARENDLHLDLEHEDCYESALAKSRQFINDFQRELINIWKDELNEKREKARAKMLHYEDIGDYQTFCYWSGAIDDYENTFEYSKSDLYEECDYFFSKAIDFSIN